MDPSSSVPEEPSSPDTSLPDMSSEASVPTITDLTEIGDLDATSVTWGPGVRMTGEPAQPEACVLLQQQYGTYDADFVAADTSKVYLTFDEGYSNDQTAAILDILKEKDAKAVFFLTAGFVESSPELVQRMIDEGHTLGNHSTRHLNYPEMTLEDAYEDMMNVHRMVEEQFGYTMRLFRFPAGAFSEQTLALVQKAGYRSVFWSFAYRDYDVNAQPTEEEALQTIRDRMHGGGIYLLHAVSQTNVKILPQVIDEMRAAGYTISPYDL